MATRTRQNAGHKRNWGQPWSGPLLNDFGVVLGAAKRIRSKSCRTSRPTPKDGRPWSMGKGEKKLTARLIRRQGRRISLDD